MERLQKTLARTGFASRREAEEWIRAGRLSINGVIAKLGDKVSEYDKIRFDGRLIKIASEQQTRRVLIYNKPEGEICSRHDPEKRPTVYESLPRMLQGRWISVGRLDVSTSGLLLFTNDGELANRLMHPRYEIEREYAVRILGDVDQFILDRLRKGVELDDGLAAFDSISVSGGEGANVWYHVTLHEGRNREVRRLWESQGVKVSRLIRVRFGNMSLPRQLRRGNYIELSTNEMEPLLQLVGLAKPKPEKRSLRPSGKRSPFSHKTKS